MIRVMVGICTAEQARRAAFYDYYHALQVPQGTMSSFVHGQSIANSRNLVVQQALNQGASHILFIDDDTAFKPDALIKLFCHNVDMVTGLHLMRNYPHRPLIYDEIRPDGQCHIKYLNGHDKGLIKIAASGLGFCLIRCKVFSKLEEPFFRLGEIDKDGLSEDLGFFRRVQALGLQHHCDLDVLIGHMSSTIVWPNKLNDKWMTAYETTGSGVVQFAQVEPELEKAAEGVI